MKLIVFLLFPILLLNCASFQKPVDDSFLTEMTQQEKDSINALNNSIIMKKNEQDTKLLMAQIKEAGHELLSVQWVCVEPEKVRRKKMGPVGICPLCGEAYPSKDGEKCRNCQGETFYSEVSKINTTN